MASDTRLPPLKTHVTEWVPEHAQVTLNVTLDAAFVPSERLGTRLDLAHVVVLDDFISEEHRQQLLDWVTEPGWSGAQPPEPKWERATCDGAELPPTWGLTDDALRALADSELPAKLELQSRLCCLYPEFTLCHMPSHLMQPWRDGTTGTEDAGSSGSLDSSGNGGGRRLSGKGGGSIATPCGSESGSGGSGGGCSGNGNGGVATPCSNEGGSDGGATAMTWGGSCAGAGGGATAVLDASGGQQARSGAGATDVATTQCNGQAEHGAAAPVQSGDGMQTNGQAQHGAAAPVQCGGGRQASGQLGAVAPVQAGNGMRASGRVQGACTEQAAPMHTVDGAPSVDANPYVANAAVHGDRFQWHVDADPADMPPSVWTEAHGIYCNREPGKPLLFSLLLYLDAHWPRENDAETLFLDTGTDTGLMVRPRPRRAVLLDQDVVHRLSVPSAAAQRPRYSLVLKLVMLPRQGGPEPCLARPEWGEPSPFGSAARAHALVQQLARKRNAALMAPPPRDAGGGPAEACGPDAAASASLPSH